MKNLNSNQKISKKPKLFIVFLLALNYLAFGQTFNSASNPTDAYYSPASNGSVAIGPTSPLYKLHVTDNDGNTGNVAGYFDYTASTNSGVYLGVSGNSSSSGVNGTNIGVEGNATAGLSSNVAYVSKGVSGIGSGGGINYGGYFDASATASSGKNVGVHGIADNSSGNNYGVFGTTGSTNGTGNNFGVYGLLNTGGTGAINAAVYCDANGNTGASDWALYTVGRTFATGAAWTTSDLRYKKNINQLTKVSEKLSKLNGYTYEYRKDEFKAMNFDDKVQIGFIAQELKEVFPELVSEDVKGFYSVNYQGMIPVLLEGFKAQQEEINKLKAICQSYLQKDSPTSIESSNVINQNFSLEQNEPNPFTHETIINYSLPEGSKNSYIAIYDLAGKQIETINISQNVNSSVTITSETLPSGIYLYSILTDGKILGMKRMIVTAK